MVLLVSRKGEKILAITSIVLSFIGIGLGVAMWTLDEAAIAQFNEFMGDSESTLQETASELNSFGTQLSVSSAVAIVFTLIGVFLLKTDRRSVMAGVLFFISSIAIFVGTFVLGFLPAILLFIAGFMAVIRKPSGSSPAS